MVIQGTFTSVWDGGVANTPATLDTETGEVSTNSIEVSENFGTLMEEWFEDENGEEYEICPVCHEFILRTYMEPGIGHNLDEIRKCMDESCDFNS